MYALADRMVAQHRSAVARTSRDARVSELYRRYGAIIYARCRRVLRDDTAAEDATQEVFVRVLRHLEEAPETAGALRWISRISMNYCLNLLRDSKWDPELAEELPDRAGEHLEHELSNRDFVRHLLETAPERVRTAAVMFFLEGMDQGEVARRLGVSRRTIVTRVGEFAEQARAVMDGAGH